MGVQCKPDLLQLQQLAKALARRAGKMIIELRRPSEKDQPNLDIEQKSSAVDLVTRADIASQSLIFNTLRETCPTHRLIGEEDESTQDPLDNRPTWIVDAIDGTTNFVHDLLNFSVSIGFAIGKQIVLGAVYNPATDEMFSAVKGYGAFVNDERLHVSDCSSLREALVISEWSYERSRKGVQKMLEVNQRLLMHPVRGIRQLGSGSLDMCYVAMGRVQAVYGGVATGDKWKIWDYAAGVIIAEEAGAFLRSVDGSPFDIEGENIVCAAPGIVDELLSVLNA